MPGPLRIIWGVNKQDDIYCRTVSDDHKGWEKVDGSMSAITVGAHGAVWSLDSKGTPYVRTKTSKETPYGVHWEAIEWHGKEHTHFTSLSSGGMGVVWGVGKNKHIYARIGITEALPGGAEWVQVAGDMYQVAVGPRNEVWAITPDGKVVVRTGVAHDNKLGVAWKDVTVDGAGFDYISVGGNGAGAPRVWALTKNGEIYCRLGVTAENPAGDKWAAVDGRLTQLHVGPTGIVIGVNDEGLIFERTGVTVATPQGLGWNKIDGLLKHVESGQFE